jgi:gliding motility-associated-like protein
VATLSGLSAGNYAVTVADANGCSQICSFIIGTENCGIQLVAIGQTPPCDNDGLGMIDIQSVTGGVAPYRYRLNGGSLTTLNTTPFSINGLITGGYILEIEDSQGCTDSAFFQITPAIPLELDLGPDQFIEFGDSVLLNAQINFDVQEIEWTPIDYIRHPSRLTTFASPRISTIYRLRATDRQGCVVEDDIRIFVDKRLKAFVPNAFSPNNDGKNDRLHVFADDDVMLIVSFQIYDRWGTMVYDNKNLKPNDISEGWDGSFRGQTLNPDVFIYSITLELTDGDRQHISGEVILIK